MKRFIIFASLSIMFFSLATVSVGFAAPMVVDRASSYEDVTVNFSESMDMESLRDAFAVTIHVPGVGYGSVIGSVELDESGTKAIFRSSSELIPGMNYSLEITGARSADGLDLETDEWTFEAGAIEPEFDGTIRITEKDGVRIHTYLSDTLQATHIIESENSLVLVDAQFMASFAREFRSYADSLSKPIERVIISHTHPDHFFGLGAAFEDVEDRIYALEGVRQFIETAGPGMLEGMRPMLGDAAPDRIVVPSQTLEPGTEIIDGVTYEFERYTDGEASEQLVIRLPGLNTLILQDLAFNGLHLYMGNNTLDGWTAILESLQNLEGYDTVLCGHGEPGDMSVIAANIAYLEDVNEILADVDNAGDFKTQLLAKYPDLGSENYIDMSSSALFPEQPVPDTVEISGNAYMEGLAVYGTDIFTSNWTNGEIRKTNFETGTDEIFAAGVTDGSKSGWGLATDPVNNLLLALTNGPLDEFFAFFFGDPASNPIQTTGSLQAFDLTTGQLVSTWPLPEGSAGNAVTLDNDGNIYISDVALGNVLRLDRNVGEVEVWAANVMASLGGCVSDGESGIYVHGGSQLVKISIQADGSAGTSQPVALTGDEFAQADGLTWSGDNTLFTTVNSNSVAKITLDGDGGGVVETFLSEAEGIGPTSVTVADNYLFVNDGQLFGLFSEQEPVLPFEVVIRELF